MKDQFIEIADSNGTMHKLYYREWEYQSEWGISYGVEFFKETKTEIRKKYLFFGPIIVNEEPVVLFDIRERLDNIGASKEWWHDKIKGNLDTINAEELREKEILEGRFL